MLLHVCYLSSCRERKKIESTSRALRVIVNFGTRVSLRVDSRSRVHGICFYLSGTFTFGNRTNRVTPVTNSLQLLGKSEIAILSDRRRVHNPLLSAACSVFDRRCQSASVPESQGASRLIA